MSAPPEGDERREPRATAQPVVPSTPRLRAPLEEAPKAPWHPFPLVELSVLIGMVLVVVGVLSEGDRRPILLFSGIGLISIASLELAIREHFAGYRSHSSLLAGIAAVGAAAALYPTSIPGEILTVVGLVCGGVAFYLLRRQFAARARGLTFRA
ncbi:MAG: hypothetical protein AVDCRST_MAG85-3124 [uncultured Solirubrobacteraceae bacterium]|uniref:Uncharacterized protein n=1 Tax=uncultured Solirubrobacteraceae bacterium TaxID=1162706 RepID=A0A6J4TJ38_9ACTN|nr:MAG: hypothetical protein AVDCRST_MAG85-3124 [uncultured Solirubrobacteraceae bacterium]